MLFYIVVNLYSLYHFERLFCGCKFISVKLQCIIVCRLRCINHLYTPLKTALKFSAVPEQSGRAEPGCIRTTPVAIKLPSRRKLLQLRPLFDFKTNAMCTFTYKLLHFPPTAANFASVTAAFQLSRSRLFNCSIVWFPSPDNSRITTVLIHRRLIV